MLNQIKIPCQVEIACPRCRAFLWLLRSKWYPDLWVIKCKKCPFIRPTYNLKSSLLELIAGSL